MIHRSFFLPIRRKPKYSACNAEFMTDKATANFKDGVLEIRVPKTEEAKAKEKKIPIQ
ncbi:MAG: Hsp20 family protein [Nitrospira sp.]|nr:Hsp20 family protein [Nitrospira sp.]